MGTSLVLTAEELRERIALCRELGVFSYREEPGGAFSFQLGPVPYASPSRIREPEEVITQGEIEARKQREFRRVATLHNPASRQR